MDEREAARQLETIRTLMERAALYRRALGPTLAVIGVLGVGAGLIGFFRVGDQGSRSFVLYWSAVAALAVLWTTLQMRGQAVRAGEPFWTPPTRRVFMAMTPPLAVAVLITAISSVRHMNIPPEIFAPLWMVLYGLGLHAAGYFTLRGVRLLGWAFILAGITFITTLPDWGPFLVNSAGVHLAMALTFGLGHLAAGLWLLVVEKKTDA